LPSAFYTSTAIILVSSLTFWLAFKSVKEKSNKTAITYSLVTLVMAVLFAFFQWIGFTTIVSQGFYFTGAESTVTTSFVYVLVLAHFAHLIGGIVVLLFVLAGLAKDKYNDKPLGFVLAHTFWHFLGFLWLYLFVFLFFLR
jgi:cytochrome c oxidase subunit 3